MSIRTLIVPVDEKEPVEIRYVAQWADFAQLIGATIIQRIEPREDTPSGVAGWQGWVDEHGKDDDSAFNYRATRLGAIVGWAGYPFDRIFGAAIFTGITPSGSGDADVPEILETVCVEMGCEVHWYDSDGGLDDKTG